VIEQQPDGFQVSALGRRMKCSQTLVVRLRVADASQAGVVQEEAAYCFDVAVGTGLEEEDRVLLLALIELSFQGTPTGKPVVLRDGRPTPLRALTWGQPAAAPAIDPWPASSDTQARRVRAVSMSTHTLPSICARRPRLPGWKSGSLTIDDSQGWVRPFTRTVGRRSAFSEFYDNSRPRAWSHAPLARIC
jgi:hypothetical protein